MSVRLFLIVIGWIESWFLYLLKVGGLHQTNRCIKATFVKAVEITLSKRILHFSCCYQRQVISSNDVMSAWWLVSFHPSNICYICSNETFKQKSSFQLLLSMPRYIIKWFYVSLLIGMLVLIKVTFVKAVEIALSKRILHFSCCYQRQVISSNDARSACLLVS